MSLAPSPTAGEAPDRRDARRLHVQLSAFYFVYYVAVGAFIPYWPLYLSSLGYTPAQIGIAYALLGLVRVTFPVAWGLLMDRSGRRMAWIGAGMLVSCAFFAAIPFTDSFGAMLALHVLYAVFWNAALPAFDIVTLNHLARTGEDYSRIRLWGSVGFVLAVAALGPLLDRTGLAPLPWIVCAGMLGMVALACVVPDAADSRPEAATRVRFLHVVRRPEVMALLLACFLSQFSFAPFYGFFSLYLEGYGYDRGTIGGLWALGVLAEVGVFLYAGRLIGRYGARAILMVALGTTALRWALLALAADSLPVLAASQLLHLSSFGLYHAVSVWFIHRLFPGRLQGRGQALLAAVTFGVGGSLGSLLGGLVWEHVAPEAVYWGAALAAVAGFAIARRHVRAPAAALPQPASR